MAAQGHHCPQHWRIYRQKGDIFTEYSDAELLKRFKLGRAGIIAVTDLVRDKLQSKSERNKFLSAYPQYKYRQ